MEKPLLSEGRTRFLKTEKEKQKMDQFLTYTKAKNGSVLTLQHIHIYIYIYTCAVKLLAGPSLAVLMVINWAK